MAHILDYFRLFQFRRKFRPPRSPLLLLLVLPGQDHISPLATAARFPSKLSYPHITTMNQRILAGRSDSVYNRNKTRACQRAIRPSYCTSLHQYRGA